MRDALDLRAVERLFQLGGGTTHYPGCEIEHSMCAARALLAYARTLRAALQGIKDYHYLGPDECCCVSCKQGAAVLGAARDGPA